MKQKATLLQKTLIALFLLVLSVFHFQLNAQTVTLYETTITPANGWVTNTTTGTSTTVNYSQNGCVLGGGGSITINTAQARCTFSGEIGLAGSNRWMDLPVLNFTNNPGNTSAGTLSVTWYNNGGGRTFRYYLFDAQGQQIGSATVSGTSTAGVNTQCTTYEFTLPPISGAKVIKISTNGNSGILAVTVKTYSSGTPPTVTTTTASAFSTTGATSGGDVTAEGSASVTAKGVVWNTTAAPTVALTTKTNDGTGIGAFVSSISSLTANTKYYYRAYATSSAGTGYGTESNFTTLPAAPVSAAASSVTLTSFNANWSPGTQGSETFTYTLEYSTDNTFTTGVTTVANINSSTTTQNLASLTSGGTYYYRVYAVNVQGTSTVSATQSITLAASISSYHFRSVASGNWGTGATWEASADGTTGWAATATGPDDQASSITIRNGHVVTVASDVSADDLIIEAGGRLNISSGITFTVANGAGTDMTVNGYVQNTGTITATGTINVSGSTAVYEHNLNNINPPTITWSAGSTLKFTGVYTGAGTNPTGRLTAGSYQNIAIEGQIANAADYVSLGDNAVTIGGKLTIAITGSGAVLTSAGVTSPTVAAFELSSGNVFINRNGGGTRSLTVTGNVIVSGGTLHVKTLAGATAGELNIGGDITVSGAGVITNSGTAGSAMIRFNGATSQVINIGTPSGIINYTINNTAGISLGSDLPVNGTLTFTAGNISTSSSKVIITSTGNMVNAGTNGWVAGNLQKNAATGATSRTFEVGDATAYRPATIVFGNVTTAGDLTTSVSQSAGDHANIATSGLDAGKTVNRYWSLTNSGIVFDQYDVTFTFLAGDVDAGANTAAFIIKKYNGGVWSSTTAGARTATTTQATGLTSFSDFAIGEAASAGAPPTVSTQPVSGSVCVGSNTSFTSASLSSPSPTIQWERSTDGTVWVVVDGTLDGGIYSTFTSGTLNITGATAGINGYQYRAVFSNVNGTVNSNAATITVDPASVGGTAAGSQTICSGTSPATSLTLSGNIGSVIKWQKASDAVFTTPIDIASSASTTLTSASIGNLSATTYFRAVVKSGVCAEANSTVVTITVDATSNAGTLNGNQTVCVGNAPANITASGVTGSILRWESAADAAFTTPSSISNTTATLSPGALTATTYFRVVVKSGSCNEASSVTPVMVTVNTALQNSMVLAGTPGGVSVCSNHNVGVSPNYFNNCDIIATVTPSGATPVSGNVNACVKVEAAANAMYVSRTYIVSPAAPGTATVTLYFLQSEFNGYNGANMMSDLPVNGSDASGKANLRISVIPIASHSLGGLGEAVYNPNDADIVFNSAGNRWEVSLPLTLGANNSFYVHTSNWTLPVTLVDFKGEVSQKSNTLIWTTATETNNRDFEIERSADGKNFTRIGFIASKALTGNSTSALNYRYNDESPFAGDNYYRLKQTDKDGKYGFTKVILLNRKVASISISAVYPNPAEKELNVLISAARADKINLIVSDMTGRIIMQRNISIVAGTNQQVLDIRHLAAGHYVIKVIGSARSETSIQKFVKP
jgi:hypothetical protein